MSLLIAKDFHDSCAVLFFPQKRTLCTLRKVFEIDTVHDD